MCWPAGKWRADWKFSLVSPPVPRWSRERPVKILKGEMMMFPVLSFFPLGLSNSL